MSSLKIVRGPQRSAARVVVYGTEGIGKSTLAVNFPKPLVLDTEEGTKHLDCARVSCDEWRTLTLAVTELAVDAQGFETVVIDSADWAEKLLIESMLKGSGKKSIEDYGFGKGYTMLQEHVSRFLASCDKLVAAGLNVVFVAHSKVVRTSPPDMSDGFDRYELKLTKQVSPLLKEWCDLLIFCNYKIKLVEGSDGRTKATGGRERVMFSCRTAAWDAKNRYHLPDEMPMSIEHLAQVLNNIRPASSPATGAAVSRSGDRGCPAAAPANLSERAQAIAAHIRDAGSVEELTRMSARVLKRADEGEISDADLAYLTGLVQACIGEMAEAVQ